jgi:hypothetical protein
MTEQIPVPQEWARRAHVDAASYREMYRRSIEDPDGFWAEHGKRVVGATIDARQHAFSDGPHHAFLRKVAGRLRGQELVVGQHDLAMVTGEPVGTHHRVGVEVAVLAVHGVAQPRERTVSDAVDVGQVPGSQAETHQQALRLLMLPRQHPVAGRLSQEPAQFGHGFGHLEPEQGGTGPDRSQRRDGGVVVDAQPG